MKHMSYTISQMTGHLDGVNRALDPWVPLRFRKRNVGGETHANSAPNDPKLSDSGPGARMEARRRKAKARAVPGFMAGRTARD